MTVTQVNENDVVKVPFFPPSDWFELPPTAKQAAAQGLASSFTIDYDTGRVWGHVAPRGRCLLDGSAECWTFPEDDDLSMSMQGSIVLDNGSRVAAGVIPMDTNHASIRLPGEDAIDFMANTGTQLAIVRYGMDRVGIWAAGVLAPGVTYGQAKRANAAAQSGDWRALFRNIKDQGRFRFTGSVTVNIPGKPLDAPVVPGIVASAYMPGTSSEVMMVGWAHTAATSPGQQRQTLSAKEAQKFLDESKRLTEQIKSERERIYEKYKSLLEGVHAVKMERGKQNRTVQRQKIRAQRSAELKALREKTKTQRQGLAERKKAALDALRVKQRGEREQFQDKVRAERKSLTEGGADERGQITEGYKQKSKALAKRFKDLREQIREEFADRSDQIKDLDPEKKPEARAALSAARKAKLEQLKEMYDNEREKLSAEKSRALEAFRVAKRKERFDLTDRQRAEREKAKQGAAAMGIELDLENPTDIDDVRVGQPIALIDGSTAMVASIGEVDGETVLVTSDGQIVTSMEFDDQAKVASALYKFMPMPRLPHYAEVRYSGGRGLVCDFGRTPEGVQLVSVRPILEDGTIADHSDAVTMPLVDVEATGRVAEYAGYQDEDGIELAGNDRLIETPMAATAAAGDCGCGGKIAASDALGNEVPIVEDPAAQIALDEIEAMKQRMDQLESKLESIVRAKANEEATEMDAMVAAARTRVFDGQMEEIKRKMNA